MKEIIPLPIRKELHKLKISWNYNEILKKIKQNKNSKKILICGTPEHGNLGDHAITYAEIQFFKTNLSEYEIFEISTNMLIKHLNTLNKLCSNEDIICINGGGSLGSLWPKSEDLVRTVVKTFHEKKIIILPQTIFYDDSIESQSYLKESLDIYNSHDNLFLCAREQYSFDFFNKYYPQANSVLLPDMVLYLNKIQHKSNRSGILLCVRQDREAIYSNKIFGVVKQYSLRNNINLSSTDTVMDREILLKDRTAELDKKLDLFRKSKLIVTDRLHGMIFAVITGTPCIALDNKSGKIRGVYNRWLNNLNYINFMDNINELEDNLESMYNIDIHSNNYSHEYFINELTPLIEIVLE